VRDSDYGLALGACAFFPGIVLGNPHQLTAIFALEGNHKAKPFRQKHKAIVTGACPLHCKGALSCFFNKFLDDHLHNCCGSKMLRFVLNFEFRSFEFVSDFGFSA
jgi:hypothetical protein